MTQVEFTRSGLPTETHAYTWDGGAGGAPHAKGRITELTDPSGTTTWTYAAQGRVSSRTQTSGGVSLATGYTWFNGRMTGMTTHSGQAIGYGYQNGRLAGITVNGAVLIEAAGYEPFGPVSVWQWGNGHKTYRDHDLDGRLATWEYRNGASVLRRELTWDHANRITAIANPADATDSGSYGYDVLDRLTSALRGGVSRGYGYDAIVWKWDNAEPFGNNAANENPSELGGFRYDLRFPGQQYDAETGLAYNLARDYDASSGRYVESDPIGLEGGLNTYSYAMSRPTTDSDPTGLAVWLCERSTDPGVGNHSYFYDDKTKKCCGRSPGKDSLSGCKEPGPPSHFCVLISSSDDVSKHLFDCCAQRAKQGPYFPGLNDCQDTTDDCIRNIQRAPPPGIDRFGPCNSCWRR